MAVTQLLLNGWDTANAVTYDVVNAAIIAQNSTPPTFDHALEGVSITGTWLPWQLRIDGDGRLLRFQCNTKTGTGTRANGSTLNFNANSNGTDIVVQISLDQIPDPVTGAINLVPNVQSANIIAIGGLNADRVIFQPVFEDWFQKNMGLFNNLFQAVNLNEKADNGDFQWLKPTMVDYAVAEPAQNASNSNSVFAVLAMTDQKPPADLSAQIDPAILDGLPAGSNSVFAISAERFASKLLLAGAQTTLKGSKVTDFKVVGDGLEVTNINSVVWQDLLLDDGSKVSPTIPAGGFHIRANGRKIDLEFKGMSFDYPKWTGSGREVISINFTQSVYLDLKQRTDGQYVLTTSNKDPLDPNALEMPSVDNLNITITLADQDKTTENALLWAGIALSILTVGCVAFAGGFKIVSNVLQARAIAAAEAINSAREASLVANATELQNAANIVSGAPRLPGVNQYDSVTSAISGGNAVAAARLYQVAALIPDSAIWCTRFSVGTGITGVIAGLATVGDWIAYGVVHNQEIAKDKLDKVASLNDFLNNALSASKWPGTTDWQPTSVRLAKSLLIYGNLKTN